ncbi:MFS transporter [Corynebacterium sp. TAE3-ERU2]|uniref:MFS transporter n=1 Tax=Corynebacterium sp. TAE3-ERU2 TaxID=2849497 RepID=UPI001C495080|nr:MFS transporter [Corynebacterium sp. TAE3-ERU2]MBV7301567.1 MFS transporter [Corynebacterium sp. TAE3-ERU2]
MGTRRTTSRTDSTTVFCWGLWDWGSAAFNAVLVTFIFGVYLTDSVGQTLSGSTPASSYLGWAIALAGVAIALLAPIVGRRNDVRGTRRRALLVWSAVTVALMASLALIRNDHPIYFWVGITIMGLASITFQFAEVNYFAQLGQVSTKANVGRVSAFGWSMGYFGGIVLLLICFFGFISGDGGLLGLSTEGGFNVRMVALLAAAWFGAFALPTLLRVPEIEPQPEAHTPRGVVDSYKDLGRVIAQLWRNDRRAVFFLIASAVFRDGLAAVFSFGAVLAVTVYGLGADDVILFGIAANVISALGALGAGWLDDRFGPKPVILASLGLMVLDGIALFFAEGPRAFWILGLILCFFVGPAQSASRSFLQRLSPAGRNGQMYGLYATTGRAISWLAPALFALFVALSGSDRAGVLGIVVVLAAGALLLLPVRQPELDRSSQPA